MIDKHYTPPSLAEFMLEKVVIQNVQSIADFTAGDGALLMAGRKKNPNSHVIAVDMDSCAIKKIRQSLSNNVSIFEKDFVAWECRESWKGKIDLVLMNPPFSLKINCKSDQILNCNLPSANFKIYGSLVFVLKALELLGPNGQLITILPESVRYSERDKLAWEYLQSQYEVILFDSLPLHNFSNCQPNIICASIQKRREKLTIAKENTREVPVITSPFEIVRGSLSPGKSTQSEESTVFFIHSKNLKDNQLVDLKGIVPDRLPICASPCIILPRVGRFDLRKLVLIEGDMRFILSDCVMAIKIKGDFDIINLYELLMDKIELLKQIYHGTGAVYITKNRLESFLNSNFLKERETA